VNARLLCTNFTDVYYMGQSALIVGNYGFMVELVELLITCSAWLILNIITNLDLSMSLVLVFYPCFKSLISFPLGSPIIHCMLLCPVLASNAK